MKKLLTFGLLVGLCAPAWAQTPKPGDLRSFDVSPAAPPNPALKHQLLFEDMDQRLPGNAAPLYSDAVLLMGQDASAKASKALDAYNAKDMKTFGEVADSMDLPMLFQELELAGRRENCDWEPPFRERGVLTVLPHLNPLLHGITNLIRVRVLRQIEQGKMEDALATLRLGYELADKVGREPTLVSGMVSIAMLASMNDCVAQLMGRPHSPNLYWALAQLPGRQRILRDSFDGGRLGSATASLPALARAKAGEELSAEQWKVVLTSLVGMIGSEGGTPPRKPDVLKDSSPQTVQQARQLYAQSRRLSPEQAAGLDPMIVLGNYYFTQYIAAYDDMYKLRTMPYPVLLPRAKQYAARVATLQKEQPGNPFLELLPTIDVVVAKLARADRQIAALGAVEALCAYAAANGGSLPKRLEDVAETPIPQNPATGKPFEYRLENGSATLADTQSTDPLTFTIKIHK